MKLTSILPSSTLYVTLVTEVTGSLVDKVMAFDSEDNTLVPEYLPLPIVNTYTL
ncbi:hypothetical protein D3C76_1678590 [compost metagenome]